MNQNSLFILSVVILSISVILMGVGVFLFPFQSVAFGALVVIAIIILGMADEISKKHGDNK